MSTFDESLNEDLPPPTEIDVKWSRENFSSRVLPPLIADDGGEPEQPGEPGFSVVGDPVQNQVLEHGLVSPGNTHIANGFLKLTAKYGVYRIVVGSTNFSEKQIRAFNTTTPSVDTGEGILKFLSCTVIGETANGVMQEGIVAYEYTLKATITNDTVVPNGYDSVDDEAYYDRTHVKLYDYVSNQATGSLDVKIVDDTPSATPDATVWVTEDGLSFISGNVMTNDVPGADTPLNFLGWSESNSAAISQLNLYGSIVLNSDGSWSYTLDNTRPITQTLTEFDHLVFTLEYSVMDADGDIDHATVGIGINGALDVVVPPCSANSAGVDLPNSGVVDVSPYIQGRNMSMTLLRLPPVGHNAVKYLGSREKRTTRYQYFGPVYMPTVIPLANGVPVDSQQFGPRVGASSANSIFGVSPDEYGNPILYMEVVVPASGDATYKDLVQTQLADHALTYLDITNVEGGTISLHVNMQLNTLGQLRLISSVTLGGYDYGMPGDEVAVATLSPGKHVIAITCGAMSTSIGAPVDHETSISISASYSISVDGAVTTHTLSSSGPVYNGDNGTLQTGPLPFTPDYSYRPGVDPLTLEGPLHIVGYNFSGTSYTSNWAIAVTAPSDELSFLPDYEFYPLDPRKGCFADIEAEINIIYAGQVLAPMSWMAFMPNITNGYPPGNPVAAATIRFKNGIGSLCTFPFGPGIETVAEGQKPKTHWTHCSFNLNQYRNANLHPPFTITGSFSGRNINYALPPYLTCHTGDSSNYGQASYRLVDMPVESNYHQKLLPLTPDMWRTESATGYFYIPFTLELVA